MNAMTLLPRRRRVLAGLLLTAVLLATGCAGLRPAADADPAARAAFDQRADQVAAIDTWRLVARLGLATGEEYWSAQLNWRVDNGGHVLDLAGPMGRGGGRLTLAEAQPAELVTRAGEQFRAEDPDALVAHISGEAIPVSGMIYWVRGLVDPARAHQLDVDADGRPLRIEQSGWTVEYREFEDVNGIAMPVRMDMERDGVELRARIGSWLMEPPQ